MKSDKKKGRTRGVTRRAALGMMGMTFAALGLGCKPLKRLKAGRKLLILGFDGMDYRLVRDMMKKGGLPNFRKLAEGGSFLPLVSSNPSQSPVAWASFITGKNPGGHGIFDFVTRDPATYLPSLSISRMSVANTYLKMFNRRMLIERGDAVLLRKGKSWWKILEENGVPATVLCVPSNFPPEETAQRTLSGMGTPDINGTMGTSSFYTSSDEELGYEPATYRYAVKVVDGIVDADIVGLRNFQKQGGGGIKVPFKVYIDPGGNKARITFQGQEITLYVGEWSGWMRVIFEVTALTGLTGIVRFYLKSLAPDFQLYMSPVNIDPDEPSQSISTPPEFSGEVTEGIGLHYTQGIPEDVVVFDEEWLTEDEFLTQMKLAMSERTALYRLELERFKLEGGGVYFCYFGSTDSCSHMFWRHRDPKHPYHDPKESLKYAKIVEEFYEVMDSRLGFALRKLPGDTTVIVMSDHGFAPYRRAFNLNRWLYENGYLSLIDKSRDEGGKFLENVDMSRTVAYALGVNGLYINVYGREGEGTVGLSDKDALVRELIGRLLEARDPKDGARIIYGAYDSSSIYSGPYKDQGPDIVIGYNSGYRASWETILGSVPGEMIRDNKRKWSGDHCMDPALVPGIFFCSRKVDGESVRIEDIAPSILSHYGIAVPQDMDGRSFF